MHTNIHMYAVHIYTRIYVYILVTTHIYIHTLNRVTETHGMYKQTHRYKNVH